MGFLGIGTYTIASFFYVPALGKTKDKEEFKKVIPLGLQRLGAISAVLFLLGLIGLVLLRL